MWLVGVIAVAAAIAVIVVVVIHISTRGDTPSNARSVRPGKGELTQLTSSMLVDRSSFPTIEGARLIGPKMTMNPPQGIYPSDPPECAALFAPKAIQAVVGGLTDGRHIAFNVSIELHKERIDYRNVVGKCGTFKVGNITNTVTKRSLPGLPDWAIAIQPATSPRQEITELDVLGYHRGVFIESRWRKLPPGDPSQEDIASLVKIFNDQVTKLEAV